MEKIKLTKSEKAVLRELHRGNNNVPTGMDNFSYVDAVLSLRTKGMIKAVVNYDEVEDIALTPRGYAYIRANPNLINPTDWAKVAAIAAIITAIATTAALFVACSAS